MNCLGHGVLTTIESKYNNITGMFSNQLLVLKFINYTSVFSNDLRNTDIPKESRDIIVYKQKHDYVNLVARNGPEDSI